MSSELISSIPRAPPSTPLHEGIHESYGGSSSSNIPYQGIPESHLHDSPFSMPDIFSEERQNRPRTYGFHESHGGSSSSNMPYQRTHESYGGSSSSNMPYSGSSSSNTFFQEPTASSRSGSQYLHGTEGMSSPTSRNTASNALGGRFRSPGDAQNLPFGEHLTRVAGMFALTYLFLFLFPLSHSLLFVHISVFHFSWPRSLFSHLSLSFLHTHIYNRSHKCHPTQMAIERVPFLVTDAPRRNRCPSPAMEEVEVGTVSREKRERREREEGERGAQHRGITRVCETQSSHPPRLSLYTYYLSLHHTQSTRPRIKPRTPKTL